MSVHTAIRRGEVFFADLHGMYSRPDGSQYPYFIARYERVEP